MSTNLNPICLGVGGQLDKTIRRNRISSSSAGLLQYSQENNVSALSYSRDIAGVL